MACRSAPMNSSDSTSRPGSRCWMKTSTTSSGPRQTQSGLSPCQTTSGSRLARRVLRSSRRRASSQPIRNSMLVRFTLGLSPSAAAVDLAARRHVLGVVAEQSAPERDQLRDAPVGDAVVDRPILAAALDEAAPAQAAEVVGDLGLRFAKQLDELADRALPLGQGLEDANTGGIAKGSEVLGQQLGLERPLGELKGCLGDCAHTDRIISTDYDIVRI